MRILWWYDERHVRQQTNKLNINILYLNKVNNYYQAHISSRLNVCREKNCNVWFFILCFLVFSKGRETIGKQLEIQGLQDIKVCLEWYWKFGKCQVLFWSCVTIEINIQSNKTLAISVTLISTKTFLTVWFMMKLMPIYKVINYKFLLISSLLLKCSAFPWYDL